MTDLNLDEITDVTVLKALAFDQLLVVQQAQANLHALKIRLAQLEQT